MNYLRLLGIVVLFVLVGLGTVGGCSSNNKGSGEGCCVIGPDACVDDTNKAECDFLGGELSSPQKPVHLLSYKFSYIFSNELI